MSRSTYDEAEGRVPFSRYDLEVTARRKPGYFLWQVFLPLFLIISTSWAVFWISQLSDQIAIAFTSMLTVVAFNFYTSTLLPRLPYNTYLEVVIISGYVTIFLAIAAVVGRHVAAGRGREEAGRRLMVTCRWLFPVAYLVSLAGLSWSFLG